MFTEYKDWITNGKHSEVLGELILRARWKFGQVSDNEIEPNFPMWFQNFYDPRSKAWGTDVPEVAKELTEEFMKLVPENYILVRSMASANTFGLDGDWHTDWPDPDTSITGVLYTDRNWERNWGGETVFVDADGKMVASEYEPRKLITFDGSIPHIGKGPQRRCKEMRSILAFQAVDGDVLEKRMQLNLK